MKIIDEHGNEVDAGCLVEEIMEPQVKKSKVVRIPDATPTIVKAQEGNGESHSGRVSFREKVLEELDFPENSFHEVSKHDLQESRIADPIAFRIGSVYSDNTHVIINFYARKYVVEVTWSLGIRKCCRYDATKSSATFNMDYEQEQTNYSGISMIKNFILSTTNGEYHETYEMYCKAKGITQ